MALQFSTTLRNGFLGIFNSSQSVVIGTNANLLIFAGSPPANCGTGSSGTLLVDYGMNPAWFSVPSAGAASITGATSATALASGAAGYFRLYESTLQICHMQGTVSNTGDGGDATISNTSISVSQGVSVTGWTITAPGA
jgi:hypothetical protein